MIPLLLVPVLVAGCGVTMRPVEGDLPCHDTAVAISRRTYECTADRDVANARYELFFEEYTCTTVDFETDVDAAWYDVIQDAPGDWFHCAWAVGELPCELVAEYGDDLDAWLSASPVCPYVIDGIGEGGGESGGESDAGGDTGGGQ